MKTKQHVLLAAILVTSVCIILYEAGVLKVEAPKNLFADDTQKAIVLKQNEETITIPPDTKMRVAWNSSEGKLTWSESVVYTTIDASMIHVSSSGNPITIPVDQVQKLIVHKGTKSGKYAKNGFLIGGAVGAFIGILNTVNNDEIEGDVFNIALCSGLICGVPVGLGGAVVGASTKNDITYPISPNDWEIVIE